MLSLLSCTVDLVRGTVHRDGVASLTSREADLLRYFVAHPSRVVTREELLAEVWGYSDAVVSRACDNTVRRLRDKIEADPAHPDHVLTAHGVGYRFEPGTAAAPVVEAPPASVLVDLGAVRVDLVRRRVHGPDGDRSLTEPEAALLDALLRAGGAVVEREDLVRAAWGRLPARSRALDSAMAKLRAKIEADPANPVRLRSARNRGYRLEPPTAATTVTAPELIGRDPLVARVRGLIAPHAWVVLQGPAGVGKSSLARQIARTDSGPVVWIDLAPALTVGEALTIAARVAEVAVERADDVDRIGFALGRRAGALVVLDHLEALGTQARVVVDGLRRAAPAIRWLGTSRVRVSAEDEVVVEVEPLALADAVTLFLRRAGAASSVGAALEADEVQPLVARLGCLPLAIGLAAAQTSVLGVRELSERLTVDLAAPTSDPRHRSLRAAIDPSLRALPGPALDALVTLSALRTGFTVDDAEGLLGEDGVDLLQLLRDHSLIHATTEAGGLRFGTFDAVREVLAEMPPTPSQVRERLAWLGRMGDPASLPRHGWTALDRETTRLYEQVDDVVHAAREALALGEVELAARCACAAALVRAMRGPYAEGVALIDEILDARPPGVFSAWLHFSRGNLRFILGQIREAGEDYVRAADVAAEHGVPWVECEALRFAAGVVRQLGHREQMPALLVRSLDAARRHGGTDGQIEHTEAALAGSRDDVDTQQELLRRGLARAERAGSIPRIAAILAKLGEIARIDGRIAEAHRRLVACDARCLEAGLWRERANTVNYLLGMATLVDDHAEVDRWYPEALAMAARLASPVNELDARISLVGSLLARGEPARAAEELDPVDVLLAGVVDPDDWAAETDRIRAEILLAQGEIDAARRAVERSVARYAALGTINANAEGARAMVALVAGDRASARAILTAAPETDRANRISRLCQWALLADDGGAALLAEARTEAARSGRRIGPTDADLVGTLLGPWAARFLGPPV